MYTHYNCTSRTSCAQVHHEAIGGVVITGRAHCLCFCLFEYIYIFYVYITLILLLYNLSTLCVMSHF